jgi:hypothetical protein
MRKKNHSLWFQLNGAVTSKDYIVNAFITSVLRLAVRLQVPDTATGSDRCDQEAIQDVSSAVGMLSQQEVGNPQINSSQFPSWKSYPRNRQWRLVFPVRYEHHLHTKK